MEHYSCFVVSRLYVVVYEYQSVWIHNKESVNKRWHERRGTLGDELDIGENKE